MPVVGKPHSLPPASQLRLRCIRRRLTWRRWWQGRVESLEFVQGVTRPYVGLMMLQEVNATLEQAPAGFQLPGCDKHFALFPQRITLIGLISQRFPILKGGIQGKEGFFVASLAGQGDTQVVAEHGARPFLRPRTAATGYTKHSG